MRVNMITYTNTYNVGAHLQAYALQRTIIEMGHDCAYINWRKEDCGRRYWRRGWRNWPNNLLSYIYSNDIEEGYHRFEEFIEKHEIHTQENYSNYEKIKLAPPSADVYLSGSDQVFHPCSLNPLFFLAFVPDGIRKISYAGSMNVTQVPESNQSLFKQYLSRFACLSVREEETREAILRYTGLDSLVHIDPVFLRNKEQWSALEKSVEGIKKPYIFCYILYRPKWLNEKLRLLHQKTGMDIVLFSNDGFRNIYSNHVIRNAGPSEFLWLINNAKMVVSSSFHGTAMSIVYGKPFYAIINPLQPSRIVNLLSVLGLNGNVMDEKTEIAEPHYMDTSAVLDTINLQKRRSISYLKMAIEG